MVAAWIMGIFFGVLLFGILAYYVYKGYKSEEPADALQNSQPRSISVEAKTPGVRGNRKSMGLLKGSLGAVIGVLLGGLYGAGVSATLGVSSGIVRLAISMGITGQLMIGVIAGAIVGACSGAFIGSGHGISLLSRKGLDSPLISNLDTALSGALVGAVLMAPRNVSMKMRHRLREFSVANSRFP